jgi:NAD(P)-dependent dehydrogenase (short-subunit alcohol dehydrogenase family)
MGICDGRVVIVTGSGTGIGKEHALEFGRQGAKVVVCDLGVTRSGEGGGDAKPAEEVVEEIKAMGSDAIPYFADVTDFNGCGEMVKAAIDTFGGIDIVVNNAGFLRDRMFASCGEDEWDSVIKVHMKGHFCTSRHAVGYWRDQSKAGNEVSGRIINTSSGAGLQGSVAQSTYSAAKAGIANLTLVQAAELGRYGITANAICPSARTRMTEEVFKDMMAEVGEGEFDAMDPSNISPLVAWLGSVEAGEVTGQIFEVEGGKISVADGWRRGPEVDKGARWDPAEVGGAVKEIMGKAVPAQKVYGSK